MTDQPTSPADWYPDPFGRHQMRYYDGTRWTEHVASDGVTSVDPPVAAAQPGGDAGDGGRWGLGQPDPVAVEQDVARATGGGAAAFRGGGSVFTEPVLVVSQAVKLIELTNEYSIMDQHARPLAVVREVGQSSLKKAVRLLSSLDQYLTHQLQVVGTDGTLLLTLTRPAKVVRSRVVVVDGTGREVGQIVQQNAIGKIRFALESGGTQVGMIRGENWRAWNFAITDQAGTEVARITKTWEGLAKTLFTTADNYVVQVHRPLDEPLRSLVVAAAVSVDTALKQDSRGLG